MAEINLLRNELKDNSPWSLGKTGLKSFYIAALVLALELMVFAAMHFYQNSIEKRTLDLDKQAGQVDLQIGTVDKKRQDAILVQKRLANMDKLLAGHVLWSQVFTELEKHTLKSAILQSLEVDTADHKFTITGLVPNYTDLGKLMLGLSQSPNILDVNLQSSGFAKGEIAGYGFNIEVTFNPKILKK